MGVIVKNLNKKYKLDEKVIKKLVTEILKILKRPHGAELEVIFLSDSAMRALNRRFRHRDASTDVLSFNLGESGDVVISADTALRNSKIFNTSFEKELILYIIHGILHFFGYEDGTPSCKTRMSKKENAILEKLCRKNLSKVLTRR